MPRCQIGPAPAQPPFYLLLLFVLLLSGHAVPAQSRPEEFDATGLSSPPKKFSEQKLREMIASHKRGDLADAILIQNQLAKYYSQIGDTKRAKAAEERALAAKNSQPGAAQSPKGAATQKYGDVPGRKYEDVPMKKYGDVPAPKYDGVATRKYEDMPAKKFEDVPTQKRGDVPTRKYDDASPRREDNAEPDKASTPDSTRLKSNAASEAKKADFTGRYFGYQGRMLHTWDFNSDATFLHRRTVSGSGTNVGTSERGTFHLTGDFVELRITDEATAFGTPSVGGRGTILGAGTNNKMTVRRVKIKFLEKGNGIVLEDVPLQPRNW